MEHVDDQHEWTSLMDGVLSCKWSGYILVNKDTTVDISVQGGNPLHKRVPEPEAEGRPGVSDVWNLRAVI